MNRPVYYAVILALLVCGQRELFAQEKPKQDNEAMVRAAIEGYVENRNSFRFLRCAYTETVAHTKTIEDALSGNNYLKPAVSRRLLLIDGPNVLQTQDFDEAAFKEAIKKIQNLGPGRGGGASTPFATLGYLADGPNKFNYSPFLRCANVVSPESPHLGEAATVLALGNPTPQFRSGPDYGRVLRSLYRGKAEPFL
jgi:hypothetical protein